MHGNYIDDVLQMRRYDFAGSSGARRDYNYLRDDQYSIIALQLSDGSADPIVERVRYDAFGKPTFINEQTGTETSASQYGNTFAFQGRRWDALARLYHYRLRAYDPATGQFLQKDPIGIWGDLINRGNGYTFVGNGPWDWLDPLGLQFTAHQGHGMAYAIPTRDELVDLQKKRLAEQGIHECKQILNSSTTITQNLTDFNRGIIDNGTFGLSGGARGLLLGENGEIISESAYTTGEVVGTGTEILIGYGAGKKVLSEVGERSTREVSKRISRDIDAKKRVGRWMNPDELNEMKKTGKVQEGGGGQTRVADPASPDAYKNAPEGDVFVEFDVPADRVKPHSEGTGRIPVPNSPDARIPGKNPEDFEMPDATNIEYPGENL